MRQRRWARIAILAVLVTGGAGCAAGPGIPTGPAPGVSVPPHPVVPRPARLDATADAFVPARGTALVLPDAVDPRVTAAAERVAHRIRDVWGLSLPVVAAADAPTGAPAIRLEVDPAVTGAEAYRLVVAAEGITLTASAPAGLFYGLQTLDQLVPQVADEDRAGEDGRAARGRRGASSPAVPGVVIEDGPRFPYRGMHLDVGRHFFGVEFVKRYLDAMAAYKLNTFHWHLTEDQGWRLEIQGYPRLTEVGGCRAETMVEKRFDPYVGDGQRYCGWYTQAEAREIVAYARDRFITVVPEIEMPGHSLAALAAYPELACTPGPFDVGTRWGVYQDILCPKESTFRFLEDVLTEVMAIFPGPFIHIGGDEAPKARWEASDVAQRVIEREGLGDEHELQSWFIARIQRFLADHGRRLIGWDEILEGGLPPDATVMSWRGTAGGIEAAEQGHDVIMTPTSHLYFDYYQGDPDQEPLANGGAIPLERVYRFEPIPDELDADAARHILGAQGNVWTEYMRTEDHVEYMVFPRMLALSEVVWSPADARSWDRFVARLPAQIQRLARLGVNYRLPDVLGIGAGRLTLGDEVTVPLRAPVPGGVIRYTLDGSDPDRGSAAYEGPITVRVDTGPVTVSARVFSPDRAGAVSRSTFRRTTLAPALDLDPGTLRPGLRRERVTGGFRSVTELDRSHPMDVTAVAAIGIPEPGEPAGEASGAPADEPFGLRYTGYLRVPEGAVYTFRLTSDDGSALFIDHRRVVDNDGLHGPVARDGHAALAAGLHRFELRFFEAGGGEALELMVGIGERASSGGVGGLGAVGSPVGPSGETEFGPVPVGWLFHYPRR